MAAPLERNAVLSRLALGALIGGALAPPRSPWRRTPMAGASPPRSILDHLKMTAKGSFEIHKGRWSAFTNIVYPRLPT
jgi:hypothetical protein